MSYAPSFQSISGAPLGDAAAIVCPAGKHSICTSPPPQGVSTQAFVPHCACIPDPTTTAVAVDTVATATKRNWGLVIGIAAAAFIVFKIATR